MAAKNANQAGKAILEGAKKEISEIVDKNKANAQKEITKVRKQVEANMKKVDAYIKKNPEKSALISAGIGAALGAVTAMFLSGGESKKKRK
ncbi:MAG: hypothetical protein WDN67_00430 [Candidatus Moraniibacteriota bacterium]